MRNEEQNALLARIGRNAKAERVRAGLLQEDVAHKASLGVAHYARLERGEVNSGVLIYIRIAQALGIPLAELFKNIP